MPVHQALNLSKTPPYMTCLLASAAVWSWVAHTIMPYLCKTKAEWGFSGGDSGKEPTCQCMRLKTWVWSLGGEEPLEKCMATHSSFLAWRIPMDKGTWWLWSIGWQRVRHQWSFLAQGRVACPGPLGCPLAEIGLGPGIIASSLFLSEYSLPLVWEACICSELVPCHSKWPFQESGSIRYFGKATLFFPSSL